MARHAPCPPRPTLHCVLAPSDGDPPAARRTHESNTYRHWLPLVTRCPLSPLPDLGYVEVSSPAPIEIHALRRAIFENAWTVTFMEDLTERIADAAAELAGVPVRATYRLAFGRTVIERTSRP
jgi:hypothetical protein